MKKVTIALTILALGFSAVQVYLIMSSNRTQQQKYRVERVDDGFEIRYYPPAVMATVTSSANQYRELAYPGFRKLAGYIFGGNETGEKIAMTSPVHMDMSGTETSMSFVMPEGYTRENLPDPQNPEVHIHESEGEFVAAIRFGGFANDERIRRYSERLRSKLESAGIAYSGHFRYLGYNPPYQLLGRRNEIIVRVENFTQTADYQRD